MARSQVGVREKGGNNRGPEVEMYQKVVDGKAQREAWCMAFVQYVVKKVCDKYGLAKSPLYQSEHCQTVYVNTKPKYQLDKPKLGAAFIQKNRANSNGHTGIVTGPVKATYFPTIEGNTNGAGSSEGDGVYEKTRSTVGGVTMLMRGYVDVVELIYDAIQAKS